MSAEPAPSGNRYSVSLEEDATGWRVVIADPSGRTVFERPSPHEGDAMTFASTVRQHIYWLSEERFRRYYRIAAPEGP